LQKLIETVKPQLDIAANFIIQQLPHLYFEFSSDKYNHLIATTLCHGLKSVLPAEVAQKVICRSAAEKRSVESVQATQFAMQYMENSDVASFQVVLWFVVAIFCIFGAVMYCMLSISGEAQKSTEIYWETRTILEKASRSTRKKPNN